jgi:hypothetical protein
MNLVTFMDAEYVTMLDGIAIPSVADDARSIP